MRTRGLIVIGFLLLISSCVTDDGDNYKRYYTKYYGADGDQEAADMFVNPDGTIVIIGTTEFPANSGNTRTYIVKIDSDGKVIWEKTYGSGTDIAQDVESVAGGFVILSNLNVGTNARQFKLTLIDDNGNKTDSLVYDSLADQYGQSVTPLSDGGFFVAGRTFDTDTLNSYDDFLSVPEVEDLMYVRFFSFLKTDSELDRVGSSTEGSAIKVFETQPGEYITTEFSNDLIGAEGDVPTNYDKNFVFRSFDDAPTGTASFYIGDNTKDEFMTQSAISFDGFIYSIGSSVIPGGASSVFITKVRKAAAGPVKIFENGIGGSGFNVAGLEGVSIAPTLSSSCYILANAISQTDGTRDIWLTKVNTFDGGGDASWTFGFTFGAPTNDDTGKVVAEAPNGDILVLGTMNLTNQRKIALIRLSSNGGFTP